MKMLFNTKKFNKEIKALQSLSDNDVSLHPLRQEQLKQQILQRMQTETNSSPARFIGQERKRTLMTVIISILASLGLLGGTAFASSSAVPGDVLYPVKRVTEKVHVAVTVSEEAKANLEAKHAEKRLDELAKVEVKVESNTDTKVKTEIKVKAELEAKVGVEHAVEALTDVKAKLEARGNLAAAAAIANNITRLETRAESQNVIKVEDNKDQDHGKYELPKRTIKGSGVEVKIENSTNVESSSKVEIENRRGESTKIEIDANGAVKVK